MFISLSDRVWLVFVPDGCAFFAGNCPLRKAAMGCGFNRPFSVCRNRQKSVNSGVPPTAAVGRGGAGKLIDHLFTLLQMVRAIA